MKRFITPTAAAVAAAVALAGLAGAAEETPAPSKQARVEKHLRIIKTGDDAKDLPKEKVTFLGVEVMPASEAMAAQLGLKRGIGLVIGHVVPDSPATAVLVQHDVLTKLNDQWLIDPHQLAVLVQSFDEGTEIGLTFLRAGKEQTAKVKLVKRERPRMTFFNHRIPGPAWASQDDEVLLKHLQGEGGTPEGRGDLERSLRFIPRELGRGNARDVIIHSPGGTGTSHVSVMALPRAVLVFSDEAGVVELRREDGKRLLEVRDKGNKVTFSGEVTTPEQRAKLAPEVAARLQKVEAVDCLDVEVQADIETEEQSVMPASGPAAKIMHTLPAHERAPQSAPGDATGV